MEWLTGWGGIRIKITVSKDRIDSDLTDFPLPVAITASDIFSEVGGSWRKIAITLDDGITQCYAEVKDWSQSEAHLFVKISLISASEDTHIYLYADAAQTDNTQYIGFPGDSAAQQVYDSGYLGVWRLSQTPTASILDSTSHNYDGTPVRMASGDLRDGQFGKCFEFRQTNHILLPDGTGNDSSDDFAVSGLAKVTDKTLAANQCIIGHTDYIDPNFKGFEVGFWQTSGNYAVAAGDRFTNGVASAEVVNDQWFHFAWVGASGTADLYIDAEKAVTMAYGMVGQQTRGHLIGGWLHQDGGIFNFFKGCISDIQLFTVRLSEAWIKAEHAGFFGELISFGTKEDAPSPPEYIVGSYQHARKTRVSYLMTLGDIQLPFSSFQLSKSETKTHLSAVIPHSDSRESQITGMSGEYIAVRMLFNDLEEQEIGRAELKGMRVDEGGLNRSITLTGESVVEYANPDFVTLADATSKNISGCDVTYRFALPDLYLRPGDTLQVDGDDILVIGITCSVSSQQQFAEVRGTYI